MRGHELLSTGQTLYIDEVGAGRCVVCIHGLGGGAYYFAGLMDALKPKHRVIAVDLPGCGLSAPFPGAFDFDRCADMVVELITQRAGGSAAVVGHSLGTIIALKAAARAPEVVRAIVSVGGLAEPLPLTRARLRDRAALIRRVGMVGLADSIFPVVFGEMYRTHNFDEVALLRTLLEWQSPENYAEIAEALATVSAVKEAHDIRVPVLAITGDEDRYAPPDAVEAFLATVAGPTQHHRIPNCGHMPFFEAPAEFIRAVSEFLDA
jgi:pimeloyl-ACP methyl ester carboxylesterase